MMVSLCNHTTITHGGDNMGCGCRRNKNKRNAYKKRKVKDGVLPSQQISTGGFGSTVNTLNVQGQAAPRTPDATLEDPSVSS
jgi:hypothetical protein